MEGKMSQPCIKAQERGKNDVAIASREADKS